MTGEKTVPSASDSGTYAALAPLPPDSGALSAFERLADIPEEELWLQNQRSAHTRL